MNKTLIIYHRVDWDGYTSAAIAYMANPTSDFLGWNYGDTLPDVTNYEQVILVDLTISDRNDYTWMHNHADKLIWIDHHMNAVHSVNRPDVKGLRRNDIGACMLTWEYFFPNQPVHQHVSLCATYDVFRKDGKYATWDDAWKYQLVLGEYGPGWTKEEGDISCFLVGLARDFIKEQDNATSSRLLRGDMLEKQRADKEAELFKHAEYNTIDGVTYCILYAVGQPAMLIKSHLDNYAADAFLIVNPDPLPNGDYKVSVRVPEISNFDASAFCRQYGGNGHIKAAGCAMSEEQINSYKFVK